MTRPKILHMITPARNVSAFDANMAIDAGYETIIPHTEVTVDDVSDLVQDAIFSRPPKHAAATGLFIGGYDVNVAANTDNSKGGTVDFLAIFSISAATFTS